jgi:hypothetical protein
MDSSKMISYNPEVLNFTSYFSKSTGLSITNGWFSRSLASCMQVIHTRGSCHEMVQNVWINLVFAIPHRVGFGQTDPYTRSLLDAYTLALKERVYMLVRPNPQSSTPLIVFSVTCYLELNYVVL